MTHIYSSLTIEFLLELTVKLMVPHKVNVPICLTYEKSSTVHSSLAALQASRIPVKQSSSR